MILSLRMSCFKPNPKIPMLVREAAARGELMAQGLGFRVLGFWALGFRV